MSAVTVELTDEQSAALARGESVTITPPKPAEPTYTVVAVGSKTGRVLRSESATRRESALGGFMFSGPFTKLIETRSSRYAPQHPLGAERTRTLTSGAYDFVAKENVA
jgi:hypothetical protein